MYPYKKAFFTAFSFCLLLSSSNANANAKANANVITAKDAASAVEHAMFKYTGDWASVENKKKSGIDDAPFYSFGVSGRTVEFGIAVHPNKTEQFIAVKLKFTSKYSDSPKWHRDNIELYKKMILQATNLQQDGMMTKGAFYTRDSGSGIEFLLHPSDDDDEGKIKDQNALSRLLNNITDFMYYLGRNDIDLNTALKAALKSIENNGTINKTAMKELGVF